MAIERVVYWNESAGGWYDRDTDIRVENLLPEDTPEQTKESRFVEAGHGSWSSYPAVTREQVQKMINDLYEIILLIDRRLEKIEKPWYKLW